jgi:hypothetical protein
MKKTYPTDINLNGFKIKTNAKKAAGIRLPAAFAIVN